MTSALAIAEAPAGLLRVEEAARQLAACKTVDEAKDLHDKAKALKVYYRQRQAALEAQQDAGVIQLMAARRVGELLEEQRKKGERQGRGDAGRAAANRPKAQPEPLAAAPAPTLEELGIERNAAQRFQAVAKVPEAKFTEYLRAQKEGGGEITTADLLRVAKSRNPHAASKVNDGADDKNERFTPRELMEQLHKRFRFTVDAAGCPDAPASQIIGRHYSAETNGFLQDFKRERTFSNVPWDFLGDWVAFTHEQVERGCKLWVHLMPANRTEQPWWHDYIEPYRPDRGGSGVRVEHLRGRVSYGSPGDPEGQDSNQPNMPSCLVIWEGPRRRSPDFPPAPGATVEVAAPSPSRSGWTFEWLATRRSSGHAFGAPPHPAISRCGQENRGRCTLRASPGFLCKRCRDGVQADVRDHGAVDPFAAGAARPAGLTVDQFKGELQQLNFSARVTWSTRSGGPRRSGDASEVVMARCLARGCKAKDKRNGAGGEVFRIPLGADRLIEREALKQLRAHSRGHEKKGGR